MTARRMCEMDMHMYTAMCMYLDAQKNKRPLPKEA